MGNIRLGSISTTDHDLIGPRWDTSGIPELFSIVFPGWRSFHRLPRATRCHPCRD